MRTALFIATATCIAANLFIAVADYAKAGFVLKNSGEVHVAPKFLPLLASLKLAGAIGLGIGLTTAPWLGVAAGTGLILFFVGAIVAHIRAKVFYNLAFPGVYLLLAVASTTYASQLATGS